jgi:uncharacterized protein YciI
MTTLKRNLSRSGPAAAMLLALALTPAGPMRGGADAAETPPASAPAAKPDSVAAPTGALFLVTFSLGPNWVQDKAPPEQVGFREHGQNLGRLRKEEKIVLGARYADKGMIVLRAESLEAVQAEMAADPGVVAGLFTFEAHPLQTFYDGCLERPKR